MTQQISKQADNKPEKSKKRIPSLAELNHDPANAFAKDQLKMILNSEPIARFIREHPVTKSAYIPIPFIEYLLDRIFQDWKVEVLREGQLFNSVYVTIRLHLCNPLNGVWFFMDGIGAMGIQTDKGKAASDMSAIKADAVMKALPAAKSYAIKDAADHIGILFGRNLTRKDNPEFIGSYEDPATLTASDWQINTIEALLRTASITDEQKSGYERDIEIGMLRTYADEVISFLRNNQLDPITHGAPHGGYGATQIKDKINKEI